MNDVQGIPADWYPDPADARRLRYWDGFGWTGQLADRPTSAADLFAHGSVKEPTTSFTGYDQGGGYVPLSRTGQSSSRVPTRSTSERSGTVAIWLWTLVPLLLLLHVRFGWQISPSDFTDVAIHIGLFAGYLFLSVLLAAIDRSQLASRGFRSLPPAVLAVLPPIHVVARVFAVGAGGVLLTLATLLVSAVVAVLLYFQYAPAPATDVGLEVSAPVITEGMTPPFTEAQIAYLLTPQGMADKLRFDAAESSLNYETVTCEPLSSVELGSQTTCTATAQIADYSILVQVLPDSTEAPFTVISVSPQLH